MVGGDGSIAPSPQPYIVDGSPMPLGSTTTHEPIGIPKSLWVRWKSPGGCTKPPLGTNGPRK